MKNESFGLFITRLRKEKNMTQKDLADKIGVSDKAVSRWENGKNYPDIEMIQMLGEVLGVSVSELLQGERMEQQEVITHSERNVVKAIKMNKKLKITFAVIIIIIAVIVAVLLAIALKNAQSDYIEHNLNLYSSDARTMLDSINAYIDPDESNNFALDRADLFMNSEKEITDLYLSGATESRKGYYCSALGNYYNQLSYTKLYENKSPVDFESGINCLDFAELIHALDFIQMDKEYSKSNVYSIDIYDRMYFDGKIEINNDSGVYVYDLSSCEFNQIFNGDKLEGDYFIIELWRMYEGNGTSVANILVASL
ncbi:MAG: helix-turn-helix domain-containing protein [Clostridium sp.]|nr:helix-turn-helix domain-containing protein [Clostridium sp.]